MAKGRFPPGFRFHPTDVELILYYLKRKVLGKPLAVGAIAEIDLYKYAPWDLPDKSSLFTKDLEWYFFCARENNPRTKRATETGYWKITGKDRTISHKSQVVGLKKTLVYHIGRFPHSTRTNWVMHEYRLNIKEWMHTEIPQDSYVLCKVFEKSGAGPKVGEQHGAPFKEEDWEDELIDASAVSSLVFTRNSPSTIVNDDKVTFTEGSTHALENTCKFSFQPPCQSSGIKGKGISFSENLDMESIFSILGEGNDLCQSGNVRNQISESFNHECGVDTPPLLGSDDIFGDLEDFNTSQKMDGIDLLDLFSGNCPPLLGDNASGHNYIGDGVGYVELNDFERPMPLLGDNASGHNYIGDAIDYVELNDFERPMKYPVGGDVPNDIQYDNFGVDSFGCTLRTNSNNILYDNFGVDSFGFSLLPTNSNMVVDDRLDMVSNDHVGFVLTKNSMPVDEVSLPFVSSKAVYLTSTVGSSGCMLPRNPFMFTNELDVASNDHIGFGTTKISSMMDGFPFVSSDTVNRSSRVEFSRCMLPKDSGMFVDNLDIVSNDHISFGVTSNNLLMGGCSVPFVSSEGIHPTPSVGSVGCELPRNSGVLGKDLDVDSNDHIGFGVVPTNQFQTLSRGEQHRDNVRLQCLLGSILAQFVPAAEYLSTVIAGEGSNGTSLYVNHGGSSLHVKAEVTVCCGCTKDALYGKLEVLSYLCCYGLKFSVSMLDKKAAAVTCSRLCDSVVVDVVWFWFLFVVELRVLLKNELHECSNKFVVPQNKYIAYVQTFSVFFFCRCFVDAQAAV